MAYALQKAECDWFFDFRSRVNDVRLRVTENTMVLVNRLRVSEVGLRVTEYRGLNSVIGEWFARHRT